jgi:hypothetical protein
MNKIARMAAAAAVITLSACGANTHSSVEPTRATSHVAQMPAAVAHGAEIESAPNLIVSEGNRHAAFPPGATLKRTANGIEVTYHGVTRTFSAAAKVDAGSYHRYAKAQ